MLIHDNTCREHASVPEIQVRASIVKDYFSLETGSQFVQTIMDDPRITNRDNGREVSFVLTEMEVVIEDDSEDPLQKFEYDDENQISEVTEQAVSWIIDNYS